MQVHRLHEQVEVDVLLRLAFRVCFSGSVPCVGYAAPGMESLKRVRGDVLCLPWSALSCVWDPFPHRPCSRPRGRYHSPHSVSAACQEKGGGMQKGSRLAGPTSQPASIPEPLLGHHHAQECTSWHYPRPSSGSSTGRILLFSLDSAAFSPASLIIASRPSLVSKCCCDFFSLSPSFFKKFFLSFLGI